MNCLKCGHPNREQAKFCSYCGIKLTLVCRNCKTELLVSMKFCDECGTSISSKNSVSVGAKKLSEVSQQKDTFAEHRHLTVMFCDLASSTELSQQLHPEDFREVVREYQTMCTKIIQGFNGYLAQYLGDGILAYFGFPQAYEDSAQRAVRSGLGIINGMETLNFRIEKSFQIELTVRIAVHSGMVVIGEMGSGIRREKLALGDTPNIAARLEGLAKPNSLVISHDTFKLIKGNFKCNSRGIRKLKGVERKLEIYEVLHEISAQSQYNNIYSYEQTPIVGREGELALMIEKWDLASDGKGQGILLCGEAGIGKSRLLHAFKEHIIKEQEAWLIESRCSPYHQSSSFHPIIELLERAIYQFDNVGKSEQKLKKLEGFLIQNGYMLNEYVPLFAPFLSIPYEDHYESLLLNPEQRKQKILQSLLSIISNRAKQQTVVFIIEDLHWIDPSTLEFLSLILENQQTEKILTLYTFRPAFVSPWNTKLDHISKIVLPHLKTRQIKRVISPITNQKSLPTEIMEQLVTKTDGIPLFIEELTKMIIESDFLEELESSYQLKDELPNLTIPTTLQDSLMARLDRMDYGKTIAQIGSVIGREFDFELIRRISNISREKLIKTLKRLVDAQILLRSEDLLKTKFIFKHSLMQELAYQSLLKRQRKNYHLQIAKAFRKYYPQITIEQPETIAFHYEEAEEFLKGIEFRFKASKQAIAKYSPSESIKNIKRGLSLMEYIENDERRDKRELDFLMLLGPAYLDIKGYNSNEVENTFKRAYLLCKKMGTKSQMFTVLNGLFMSFSIKSQFDKAQEIIDEMLLLGSESKSDKFIIEANNLAGFQAFFLGRIREALKHMTIVSEIYKKDIHGPLALEFGHDVGVFSHCFSARALWTLGYPDQAMQQIKLAESLAKELAQPYSLAIAHKLSASIHKLRREPHQMLQHIKQAISIAKDHKFSWIYAVGLIWKAASIAEIESPTNAIPIYEKAFELLDAFEDLQGMPHYLAYYTETLIQEQNFRMAEKTVNKALEIVKNTKESWYEPELHRLKALISMANNLDTKAESLLKKSLQLAQHQDAKSWELRTAKDLAALWMKKGNTKEAFDLLNPLFHGFSEGLNTKDLLESEAMLGKLKKIKI